MLEQNIFRSMMLIGSIIILAMIVAAFFTYPMDVPDKSIVDSYILIMDSEPRYDDSLTMYEMLNLNIEARSRGNVKHY